LIGKFGHGLVGVLMPAAAVCADVVQLTPVADNTLYENATGSVSNGAGTAMYAGCNSQVSIRRALLRFDIASAVPAGANVTSASLRLYNSASNTSGEVVAVHAVLESWGEGASVATGGGGSGAPAAPGDATWLHREFSTLLWATPGGVFAEDPSAAALVGGAGFWTWESAQLAGDVQAWLDNPGANFGWGLLGNEGAASTAKKFSTREEPLAEWRPVLTVHYTPVPAPSAALAFLAAIGARRRRRVTR
jgi:hypothetical protein